MRLITFTHNGRTRIGELVGDTIYVLAWVAVGRDREGARARRQGVSRRRALELEEGVTSPKISGGLGLAKKPPAP